MFHILIINIKKQNINRNTLINEIDETDLFQLTHISIDSIYC